MIIFVTNRHLCRDDFLQRIDQLAKGKPDAILLREKDLPLTKYEVLARNVKEICDKYQVPLILHTHITVAAKLNVNIHLTMSDLRAYQNRVKTFQQVGASIHSIEEAKEAMALGATYILAGHIFQTDCKKDLPPRGLSFLKEICDHVSVPVLSIGGITKEKAKDVLQTGTKGVCIMSEAMTSNTPAQLTKEFRNNMNHEKNTNENLLLPKE